MTLNKPLNHSLLDTGIITPTCRTAERINLHGVFKVLRSQWALKSFYHCLYISKLINCCCEKDLLSRFSDLHMQCLHGYIRDWQAVSLIHSFKRKAILSGSRRGEKLTPRPGKHMVSQHMSKREARTVKRKFQISRPNKSILQWKTFLGQLGIISKVGHLSQLFGLCVYSALLGHCFAITLEWWDLKGHVTHNDFQQAVSFIFLCALDSGFQTWPHC